MYRVFKCCADPRHLKVPFTIMARREHNASHSSIEWEVSRMDRSSFIASITAFHKERFAFGSIPLEGSS